MGDDSTPKFVKIDLTDPLKEYKNSLTNGVTRLGDLRNSIKRDQENLLLTMGTFFFGIVLSVFFDSLIFYLMFGIILLIFLISATIKNRKDIYGLSQQNKELVGMGRKVELDLNQESFE